MPYFRVRRYDAGIWDGVEHDKVEARDEQEAAEMVCGEPLAEGPVKRGELRAEAWLVSSPGRKKAFCVQPQRA
jgi:hypothetical protein